MSRWQTGDRFAGKVVDQAAGYLAQALAAAINLLSPDVVVVEAQVRFPSRAPNSPAKTEADGAKRRPVLFVALAQFPPGLDQPIQTTLGPVPGLSIKDARLQQPPIRSRNPGDCWRPVGTIR